MNLFFVYFLFLSFVSCWLCSLFIYFLLASWSCWWTMPMIVDFLTLLFSIFSPHISFTPFFSLLYDFVLHLFTPRKSLGLLLLIILLFFLLLISSWSCSWFLFRVEPFWHVSLFSSFVFSSWNYIVCLSYFQCFCFKNINELKN